MVQTLPIAGKTDAFPGLFFMAHSPATALSRKRNKPVISYLPMYFASKSHLWPSHIRMLFEAAKLEGSTQMGIVSNQELCGQCKCWLFHSKKLGPRES